MWTRLVGQVVWLCGRTVLFLSNFRVNQYTFWIWWSTRLFGVGLMNGILLVSVGIKLRLKEEESWN